MVTAVIGTVFVDVKGFSQVHYLPTGTNPGKVEITHGGVCRNVCENFGRQGMKAQFVSMTDNTALGRDVRERLARLGVDLTHTLYSDDGMGMWMAILDENGDLVGSISKQPDFKALQDHLSDHVDEVLEGCDNVVLEIDTNDAIAETVLSAAERLKKPVYVIVANMVVILRHPEYLARVRCYISNEIEFSKLMGEDLTRLMPGEMLSRLDLAMDRFGMPGLVVTMGERGAVYCDRPTGLRGHCPALPSRMVDSTGAGDAFFSGTVMAINRGMPLDQAVRVGTRLASATLGSENSCAETIEGLFDL